MKKLFTKKINSFLLVAFAVFALIATGGITFASCSTHILDLIVPEEVPPSDIDIDISVDFKTILIGYNSDTNVAVASGLGDSAVYVWSIDGNASSEALIPNGTTCTLDITKLSLGKHTLHVDGTVDGVTYSNEYYVMVTQD